MRIKKHKFGKKFYRPKSEKLRLRKNIKGFRRDEYWIKRCAAFSSIYYYPSKYLAER
tara:strand:- start:416 stop:586 length:171 start_codon:yes stop_codon:yes gene_type:complete